MRFGQDTRLQRRLERETGINNVPVIRGLFDDPSQEGLQVLQGTYRLEATALLFEPESDLDLTFVSYGEVHGIAGTDHERVFELFRRSGAQSAPGEGIGLAHVRTMVRSLGGDVTLTSTLGEGTTFIINLPRDLRGYLGSTGS